MQVMHAVIVMRGTVVAVDVMMTVVMDVWWAAHGHIQQAVGAGPLMAERH